MKSTKKKASKKTTKKVKKKPLKDPKYEVRKDESLMNYLDRTVFNS